MPMSVQGAFQGTAAAFSLIRWRMNSVLILAALITVYLVLGVLYESYIHPITIPFHDAALPVRRGSACSPSTSLETISV